jgi:hypothetical protein
VSCKKAIGVAEAMKAKFDGKLHVEIHTLDSEAARPYALEFRGSTNVLFDKNWVPLGVAIDKVKMEEFLSQHL